MNDCDECGESLDDGTAVLIMPCGEHEGHVHALHARCAPREMRRELQQELSRIHARWN